MTVTVTPPPKIETAEQTQARVATGSAAAALIAGGIGCCVIGLLTIGAAISKGVENLLNWWDPVGPLSGETGAGVIAFFLAWAIAYQLWKDKDVNLKPVFIFTILLVAVGFLFTFPPIVDLFEKP